MYVLKENLFLQSFDKFIFLFFQIFQIHTFFQIYALVNLIDGNTGHEEWLSGKQRTSPPNVFCKKGVLENFTKFTGKHLCQSLFLIKLQASGVFLGIQVFSYEYYEVFYAIHWWLFLSHQDLQLKLQKKLDSFLVFPSDILTDKLRAAGLFKYV